MTATATVAHDPIHAFVGRLIAHPGRKVTLFEGSRSPLTMTLAKAGDILPDTGYSLPRALGETVAQKTGLHLRIRTAGLNDSVTAARWMYYGPTGDAIELIEARIRRHPDPETARRSLDALLTEPACAA